MKIVVAFIALKFASNLRQIKSGCGARNAKYRLIKIPPKQIFFVHLNLRDLDNDGIFCLKKSVFTKLKQTVFVKSLSGIFSHVHSVSPCIIIIPLNNCLFTRKSTY